MICKIDGWVPGGMQLGVPVHVLFWGAGDGADVFLRDGWTGARGDAEVWGAGAGAGAGAV